MMPPLAHTDAALVVEGFKGSATRGQWFSLKMKPRVRLPAKHATTLTMYRDGETRGANLAPALWTACELGLDSGRVAIERKLEILPRPKWAETMVVTGDRYEIVQLSEAAS